MTVIGLALLCVAVLLFALATAWRTMPDRLALVSAGLACLALATLLPALASVA